MPTQKTKEKPDLDEFMEEEKEEDELDDFLSDVNKEDLQKSAALEIKPKLYIEDVGIEFAKTLIILSRAYKIKIPKDKYMGKGAEPILQVIDVKYEGTEHQFIVEAGSFKYQYGVIMTKLGLDTRKTKLMIGAIIKVWLEWVELPKWGKSKLYKITLVKAPPKR